MRPLFTAALALATLALPVLRGAPPDSLSAEGEAPFEPFEPFEAVVAVEAAYVRAGPDGGSPRVGLVQRGGRVWVTGCVPDCESPRAWALLEGDGALRRSMLVPPDAGLPALPERYLHGTTRAGGAPVHGAPAAGTVLLEQIKEGRTLAFIPDEELLDAGWLKRPAAGFVPRERVRLANPSTFAGQVRPAGPVAFLWRSASLTPPDGGTPTELPKYSRLPALGLTRQQVVTPVGLLPRERVRLAFARARPGAIPPAARWVHVDLNEQVLTAYEGDRLVFATLVSTGTAAHPTRLGVHRVWLKSRDDLMHGEDYWVEEVPSILYFDRGQGLHSAFWHERFGQPASHGCVNLAPADARWIFDWAPPRLPPGWHTVLPVDGRETLWVQVERAPPGHFPVPVDVSSASW